MKNNSVGFIALLRRAVLFLPLVILIIILIGCSKSKDGKSMPSKNPMESTATNNNEAKMQVWTELKEMPLARCSSHMETVNGKIYIIGGWNLSNGLNLLVDVGEYDPDTDSWIKKTEIPENKLDFGIAALDGNIYAVGGAVKNTSGTGDLFVGTNTVEKYDPESDTWSKAASLNGLASQVGAAEVKGKIYAIYKSGSSMVVEEYDPETDKWTMKSGKTTGFYGFCTAVVNGKIYLLGGTDSGGYSAVKRVEQYDPETDTWTRMPDMASARAEHTVAVLNDKIYIIGGWAVLSEKISLLEEYDPVSGESTKKTAMPSGNKNFQSSLGMNGKIYVAGGMTESVERTLDVYDPSEDR